MNFRDTQIEQYVRGRMSGKTLEEFEKWIAVDPALRRSVQVERAIAETIHRDAATMPAGTPTTMPAALAAKVSATPVAIGLNVATGGGVVGTIFGTKVGVTILSVVGTLGIALGVLLIAPLFDEINDRNTSSSGDARDVLKPSPTVAAPGMDTMESMDENRRISSSPTSVSSTNEVNVARSTPDTVRAGEQGKEETGKHSDGEVPDTMGTNTSQKMLDQLRREESARETPTVRKGSVEVQMEIE